MVRTRLSLVAIAILGSGVVTVGALWAANHVVPPYVSKSTIEAPPEALVGPLSAAMKADLANPKVVPGKVNWHPSFAEACEASKKSGKPVLLFQLLGKLDHQFC